jgi:hypothetical protein
MDLHVGSGRVGWGEAMGWRRSLAVFAGVLLIVMSLSNK